MLHDGGGERSQTVAALGSLIEDLQQRGYTFDTVTSGDPGAFALAPGDARAACPG